MKTDILFKMDNHIFSYRTTGILIHKNKVLVQKPLEDDGFSLPGGHVMAMEHSEDALKREFIEELGIQIKIDALRAVGEIYFLWNNRPCHQINLYYSVYISDDEYKKIISKEKLYAKDSVGNNKYDLEFTWLPIEKIDDSTIYPPEIKPILSQKDHTLIHFISNQL